MSITSKQPLDYPSALLKKRARLPNQLYIIVDELRASERCISALGEFKYCDFTMEGINTHLSQSGENSSFISVYESEEIALEAPVHKSSVKGKARAGQEVKVILDTSGLVPAWMESCVGVRIPVWIETGNSATFEGKVWLCLEEVGIVLGTGGEKGEWLAGGFIPRSRVLLHQDMQRERAETVCSGAGKEEVDRQERQGLGEKKSLRSMQQPPQVPIRSSSLKTVALKVTHKTVDLRPTIRLKTRHSTLSLTNADQGRALSLFKYALLVAHGKVQSEGLVSSSELVSDSSKKEKDRGETFSDIRSEDSRLPLTPSSLSRSSLTYKTRLHRRASTAFEQRAPERQAQHEDSRDTPSLAKAQEHPLHRRRSAAPSPSESLHNHQVQPSSEKSRRSRREILLELQSDTDSTLREYARISLYDADALAEAKRRAKQEESERRKSTQRHRELASSTIPEEEEDIDIWLPTSTSPPPPTFRIDPPTPPPSRSAPLLAAQRARLLESASLQARLVSIKARQKSQQPEK